MSNRISFLASLAGVLCLGGLATAQFGPPPVGTAECFGDGTGTKCPASNPGLPGHGCDNSLAAGGALLDAFLVDVPEKHTVVLRGQGMPLGSTAVFFQSKDAARMGMGAPFGDGLMCLKGAKVRLAVKKAMRGFAVFPDEGDPSLVKAGGLMPPGGTMHYQVLYRDVAPWGDPTASGVNLTNAYRIDWSL